jgi:hypothetical protein
VPLCSAGGEEEWVWLVESCFTDLVLGSSMNYRFEHATESGRLHTDVAGAHVSIPRSFHSVQNINPCSSQRMKTIRLIARNSCLSWSCKWAWKTYDLCGRPLAFNLWYAILIFSPCAIRAGIRFRPARLRICNGVYII